MSLRGLRKGRYALAVRTARLDGPSRRAVETGSAYRTPVETGRREKALSRRAVQTAVKKDTRLDVPFERLV